MPSRTPVLSASVALAAIVAVTLAASQAASPAPTQRRVNSHSGALLKAGSLSFRDLNRNGALDPYEDWRLPAIWPSHPTGSRQPVDIPVMTRRV